MQKTITSSVFILTTGVALGLCGVALFSGAAAGLNVGLFAGLVVGGAAFVRKVTNAAFAADDWPLLGLIVGFALTFVWRDSAVLHWLACAAMLLLFLVLHLRRCAKHLVDCGPYETIVELVRAGSSLFTTTPTLIRQDIRWRTLNGGHAVVLRAVGRGLVGLVPIVFVFGSLLASADARFESFTLGLFDWDVTTLLRRLAIFTGCLWLAVAVIATCVQHGAGDVRGIRMADWHTGTIEVTMVLASLNLLFFSYIVVQLSYFFGDHALIREAHSLSYSAYARRGFFELVWLSVLLLPTLFIARWLLRDASVRAQYVFRILAGALVACVLVIVASAMHRMHLYVEAYGLSELRFYSSVFMLLMTVVYAWFCVTVLATGTRRFAAGTVAAALVAVAGLVIVNPDAVIARTNIERLATTNRLDRDYLVALGSDAVPALLGMYTSDGGPDDNIVTELKRRYLDAVPEDWRAWNVSRARARSLLRDRSGVGK